MNTSFNKIDYETLDPRQKEQFNFQKVSAVLADYGFQTIWLTTDWQGADFIAQHVGGETCLKVQLKGRLTFDKKYVGKDIWVCFANEATWYVYPHDDLLQDILKETNVGRTESWTVKGVYHFPHLTKTTRRLLQRYRLGKQT